MELLKSESILMFGKFKGKKIWQVYAKQPSYLCYLRKTGFNGFSDEVLEAVLAWEESFPDEVKRVEKSIAWAKERDRAEAEKINQEMDKKDNKVEIDFSALAAASTPAPVKVDSTWGSWA